MVEESYKVKDYLKAMDISDARTKFKLRTQMINCKFNYKSDPANSAALWRCDSCQTSIDTQDHILWCPSYAELREGKDINKDSDLIDYIKKVLKIRDKLEITK